MNTAGLVLLRRSEGFAKVLPGRPDVAHAYADPASPLARAIARGQPIDGLSGEPWTIGYGFTRDVSPGDTMTRADADARLFTEVEDYERQVLALCTREPNENELAAMTCLAFNIGMGNFKKSTVLKAHNRGDSQSAARAFALWNKAAGKVMNGLTRRRAAEASLYLQPVEGELPGTMPQTIDPESRMVRSPIVGGATLAGGSAALGLLSEGVQQVRDLREVLGEWLPYGLLIAIVIGAGWVIWQRLRQRRNGWA